MAQLVNEVPAKGNGPSGAAKPGRRPDFIVSNVPETPHGVNATWLRITPERGRRIAMDSC